jgi:DNA gyrase inhibitor GyrI
MRSIERRFKNVQASNPELGDMICLYRAVKCQNFVSRTIRNFFRKLVSFDDYDPRDTPRLLKYLRRATKCTEDDHIRCENTM